MATPRSNYRWWDWASVLVLLIALITAATRLYATQWTVFLERVQYLVLLGAVGGLALGFSKFPPRLVKWIGLAYTLYVIPWQLGETLDHLLPWGERLWILETRIATATADFVSRRPVHDPILFLALMAVLFWLVGLAGGYFLVRFGQVWPAILPAGIAMIVIDHYDPGLASWARYIGIFMFASLLLIGRMTYLRYRAEWLSNGISQSPGTGSDFGRAALVAVVVLALFAWTVPVIGQTISPASQLWLNVSKPFDKFRSRISDAFSSLQSSMGTVSDVYGDRMALGTGTRLGDAIVFTVRASTIAPAGSRYYWQARTYNVYDQGWSSTVTTKKPVAANVQAFSYPEWNDRQAVSFTFTSNVTLSTTLYAPQTPLQIGRSGSASLMKTSDGSSDVVMLSADQAISAGQTYTVSSWVATPTIGDLTGSGTDYPQSIKDNYLQLPKNLSPRFAALAKQLTSGLTNPYDKVDSITQYLRRTITYADSIPNPPDGQDPIEWFLFSYQKGYCNYYASAEVLLLRTLGIPARLAVGYAEGQSISDTARPGGAGLPAEGFTVRNKDSHAWPEVYFNGIGWIEFEPTVSQPALSLPASGDQGQINAANNYRAEKSLLGDGGVGQNDPALLVAQNAATFITKSSQTVVFKILVVVGILALIGLAWVVKTRQVQIPVIPVWLENSLTRRGMKIPGWLRAWSRWSLFSPLQRAYGTINQSLSLLGQPARPSETPSERAASLGRTLPQINHQAQVLLSEYQQALYGGRPGNIESARYASRKIRAEAWKAFVHRVFRKK
jgi:transglutaminase-like putative cysteine protease